MKQRKPTRNPAEAASKKVRTARRDNRDYRYSKIDAVDNYGRRSGTVTYRNENVPGVRQTYNAKTYWDADVSMSNPPDFK
jgi:hypothetical protein|tara:strand:+ start:293 stop:532 length:240 start_codon:yes stop_codon:yes gene_type:complete